MEKSLLPKYGNQDHWTVIILKRATHTVTRDIRLKWSSQRTLDSHTCCRAFGSGAVSTCFFRLTSVKTEDRTLICCMQATLYQISNPGGHESLIMSHHEDESENGCCMTAVKSKKFNLVLIWNLSTTIADIF